MIYMTTKTLNLSIATNDFNKFDTLVKELVKDNIVKTITDEDHVIIKNSIPKIQNNNYDSNSIYKIKPEAISLFLRHLHLIPNHSGFHYIVSSIEYAINNDTSSICITKDIYPYVAKEFNSTPSRVERCIRKSIDYAWEHDNKHLFDEVAGFNTSKRPTNSQFIFILAEHIKAHKEDFC